VSVQWQWQTPHKTWAKTALWHAPSREEVETTPWMSLKDEGNGTARQQSVPEFALRGGGIQYSLVLGAFISLSSPHVSEVTVTFPT